MYKKIYTFGCSFTRDNYQEIWPNILCQQLHADLFNCAERGAGSDFVVKRLLCTTNITNNDLVVILWPSADRYDLWADSTTPHLIKDLDTCSWPDGKQPQLVNHHGTYNQESGFILNGSVPRGTKHQYFKYFYSASQSVHNWLTNIITAQLYLNSKKIPYVMATAFPLRNPIHYHHDTFVINEKIYNVIDQSKFVANSEQQGFLKFCLDNQLPFMDSHHPATASHQIWVEQVLLPKVRAD